MKALEKKIEILSGKELDKVRSAIVAKAGSKASLFLGALLRRDFRTIPDGLDRKTAERYNISGGKGNTSSLLVDYKLTSSGSSTSLTAEFDTVRIVDLKDSSLDHYEPSYYGPKDYDIELYYWFTMHEKFRFLGNYTYDLLTTLDKGFIMRFKDGGSVIRQSNPKVYLGSEEFANDTKVEYYTKRGDVNTLYIGVVDISPVFEEAMSDFFNDNKLLKATFGRGYLRLALGLYKSKKDP
ncbi:hypothetical protein CKF54_00885 [Psittacicella hinzii]|uniref:Uncharacterized protein n=2 Tax=Psittacicella hinzii TaxID=2028575 RepID=A0A3A1YAW7_9GAMM|nr:hypothetical protein CKF54_00885 [Psittacicella hinzii]